MKLSDTSAKASRVYFERLAVMTPAERVRLGAALWEAGHALQWNTARRKYPEQLCPDDYARLPQLLFCPEKDSFRAPAETAS